jgi:hypothetical protein
VTGLRSGGALTAEDAAQGHAERIVRRDPRAMDDLAPGAEVAPPDLLQWLLGHSFLGFELVAHARIGAHHVFKTKFVGAATTLVVQARWVADGDGRWSIREAEVTRVEGRPVDAPAPVSRPGEV